MQVRIFYRNFKKFCHGLSHVGLGNNAMLTAKSLKGIGIDCRVEGVDTPDHIATVLRTAPQTTHAIVEAAFFGIDAASKLSQEFPEIEFVYRNHSQIAFLQVEPGAINWFRDFGKLQEMTLNVRLSGNNERFTNWWEASYNQRCLYLPNLYPLIDRTNSKIVRHSPLRDTIRIGAFGSLRLLKNFTTCAAAAQLIARRLDRNLEFYMNVGRTENGGRVIVDAVKNMFKNLPWAKLVEIDWQDWTQFRHTIGHMDLTLQSSFTETFNIVTADSIAEGVPAVVSPAIEWVPRHWQAECDDAEAIAQVGTNLILDNRAADAGLQALKLYQRNALTTWKEYLKV